MPETSYADASHPVRDEIVRVHREIRERAVRPGTWWTGAERRAIAEEARAARHCGLCRERKAALSPASVEGAHDGPGGLAPAWVDAVHRLVTDPGRLTRDVVERHVAAGPPEDARYVELVAVAAFQNAVDGFARALGLAPAPLAEAVAGEPDRRRPATARMEGAWVPQIPAGAEGGEDWRAVFGTRESAAQISRALSLVPEEALQLQRFSAPHYVPIDHVTDPTWAPPDRTLDRLQIELIAARVSAKNECFY